LYTNRFEEITSSLFNHELSDARIAREWDLASEVVRHPL
jgi:hypothetical protein